MPLCKHKLPNIFISKRVVHRGGGDKRNSLRQCGMSSEQLKVQSYSLEQAKVLTRVLPQTEF